MSDLATLLDEAIGGLRSAANGLGEALRQVEWAQEDLARSGLRGPACWEQAARAVLPHRLGEIVGEAERALGALRTIGAAVPPLDEDKETQDGNHAPGG